MKQEEALGKGKELILLELAPETPVRVMRVIVYEGTYDEVARTLAASITVGPHKNRGTLRRIYQGDFEVLATEEEKT